MRAAVLMLAAGLPAIAQFNAPRPAILLPPPSNQAREGQALLFEDFRRQYNQFADTMNVCTQQIKQSKVDRGKHNPCDAKKLRGMLDKLTHHEVWPK